MSSARPAHPADGRLVTRGVAIRMGAANGKPVVANGINLSRCLADGLLAESNPRVWCAPEGPGNQVGALALP